MSREEQSGSDGKTLSGSRTFGRRQKESGQKLAHRRLDLRHVYSKNLRVLGTNLGSIVELQTVLDHVVQGRLRPVVDRAFPLKDARAAVQHVLDRKNKGKVLLVS